MQIVADFFVDPLIWPVYIYLAGYGFVWMIAFGTARLLMNHNTIEKAAKIAWVSGFCIHIICGTILIFMLWRKEHHRFEESEWWYVLFYLLVYLVIIVIDICLLFSLLAKRQSKS